MQRLSPTATRKKILELLKTGDFLQQLIDDASDQEKLTLIEEIWKILKGDLELDQRIRLRQALRTLTNATQHLPKGFFVKNVQLKSGTGYRSIANGGGGQVFYGVMRKGEVAVKTLFNHSQVINEMIHSDAVVWATLRHPNVLPVLCVTEVQLYDSLQPAIVLPWIENQNIGYHLWYLENEMKVKPPLSEWLGQIASGLQYLHEEGIVHGSLRTTNVMIDDDNNVKLMDYQTEQYIDRRGIYSEVAVRHLPVRWYPPEQFPEPDPLAATKEGDIYAFGCIWLHLHTYRQPFPNIENPGQILFRWRTHGIKVSWPEEGIKPPHTIEEFESTEVWKLVSKCLSADPNDRPKASELQEIAKFDTYWIREAYEALGYYEVRRRKPPRLPSAPTDKRSAFDRVRSPFTSAWDLVRGIYQSVGSVFTVPSFLTRQKP
ncbi:kinase-like protein [Panus rudis PR-1116 ss-1]|nr:kinase-like protein [Panus rudis PR-1116 ss-1]